VRLALLLALTVVAVPPPPIGGVDAVSTASAELVSTERLLAAMKGVTRYDLTATTNGARLQSDVLRSLIQEEQARGTPAHPLFVGHEQWYDAFLERTGLERTSAPLYARLSYQIGQDMLVDWRPERVVDAVLQGPAPRIAANVQLFWTRAPGKPEQFGYDDLFSHPHLRVTMKRLISYRMLDYGDRIWLAEVHGLRGRPTSGPLGVLFDLIGEARVEESRSAQLSDGFEVVRGRASKWMIDKTETVTVWPDGHAERGVPSGRADLRDLEGRLEQPLKVRFRPLPSLDAAGG
jgi:hypothetical protein